MLGLLTFIVLGSLPLVLVSEVEYDSESSPIGFNLESSVGSWNKSDYTTFVGPPIHYVLNRYYRIYINDNDPSYNWNITASSNSWLTGNGTSVDPYVIENLYFDGEGIGGLIYIRNSDKFFIIKNNWFDNSGPNEFDTGVLLAYSENGIVTNNIFTYVHRGVEMHALSSNNIVSNNYMLSDHTSAGLGRGVHVSSDDNTIYNNTIKNFYDAIYIGQSDGVIVDSNYVENTIWQHWEGSPIYLKNSNHSSVVRNTLAGAWALSQFNVSQFNSSGNTIENNTVVIPNESSTVVTTSNVPKISQGATGVDLYKSNYNLIAHNVMLAGSEDDDEPPVITVPDDVDPDDEIIPGETPIRQDLNIFILVGVLGLISVLLVIAKLKQR